MALVEDLPSTCIGRALIATESRFLGTNRFTAMSAAHHMIALLRRHLDGDDRKFLSVAMQAPASAMRRSHNN
ncbi:MAG: hypothetical protein IT165_29440 [Bryobacterales bacterium]|nr:hypothetical protein [Bryobacterales bacterium]